jgi:hypothetical protein
MAGGLRWFLLYLIFFVISGIAHAQTAPTGQTAVKPDSPQAQADLEKAKAIAGSTWALEEHVICDLPKIPPAVDPGPQKLSSSLLMGMGIISVARRTSKSTITRKSTCLPQTGITCSWFPLLSRDRRRRTFLPR